LDDPDLVRGANESSLVRRRALDRLGVAAVAIVTLDATLGVHPLKEGSPFVGVTDDATICRVEVRRGLLSLEPALNRRRQQAST
jgi:hypothetical protein